MASVLIVDDDALVARHMAQVLRQAGHTPILAQDGRSALREATEHPDIVLLDLGLPDLTGGEVFQRLKSTSETAQIPVLVITGKREAVTTLVKSELSGAPEILFKPVTAAQLCRAVNVALEGKPDPEVEAPRLLPERRRRLIKRILVAGSPPLAYQVCLRVSADRTGDSTPTPEEVQTWAEISDRAGREGLLNPEEDSLLRRIDICY